MKDNKEKNTVVGTYQNSKNFGFVVPDDTSLGTDIFISKKNKNKAKNNQKVLVKITKYPEKKKNAEGNIIEVIGNVCKDYNSYDLQVLAPIYKNRNGIYAINDHLQKLWNPKSPSKKEIEGNEGIYREKDKVIQLSNMKDESVFNGDIGIIDRIKLLGNKELYIDYDGNLVKYTKSMLQNFTLGYAISIHKSQGSEFDTVLIPFTFDYRKMLYRKLIYTGVTRCKKKLILVGDINALEQAIRNNQEQKRRTSLKLFLENGIL